MDYLDYCKLIYERVKNKEIKNLELLVNNDFASFWDVISKDISGDRLKALFRNEVDIIIKKELSLFEYDINTFRKIKSVSYYESSIAAYSSFFLFWIWDNNVNIDEYSIKKIVYSIFLGTIGYRLVDVYLDNGLIGPHASILGSYMIRKFEKYVYEIFGYSNANAIINKHLEDYLTVEYKEKSSLWQESKFSWERPHEIGLKTAPLFILFELIFKSKYKDIEKTDRLIKALIYSASAIQMMDDISDAYEDLNSGIETLVMKGFYKKNNFPKKVERESIQKFLSHERIKRFFDTTNELFEKAREIFIAEKEDIFLLFLEIQCYRFYNRIEIEEVKS